MVRKWLWVCIFVLAMNVSPAENVAEPTAPSKVGSVSARLLGVTNEMWFLLSGVVDKASADAVASRFNALAEESSRMSDELFDSDAQALDVEALDQDTYRIAETYEDLSYEFESLCRARCFGSAALTAAFVKAMRMGVFSDDGMEFLQTTSIILSEQGAHAEISRLKSLELPDRELLGILTKVRDAHSADAAAPELSKLTKQLRLLLPENRLRLSNFTEPNRASAVAVCTVLEPVLWKIRAEIVRIVSLPGYDDDSFDSFSDALDSVFESLSETHAECFESVFDASFRSDLDDALHESVTSSN